MIMILLFMQEGNINISLLFAITSRIQHNKQFYHSVANWTRNYFNFQVKAFELYCYFCSVTFTYTHMHTHTHVYMHKCNSNFSYFIFITEH